MSGLLVLSSIWSCAEKPVCMAGAIPCKSELHYCGLDSLHVVVLDDISEYYYIHCTHVHAAYKIINVFLYMHDVTGKIENTQIKLKKGIPLGCQVMFVN